MTGGSISVQLVPLDDARLDRSLRPFTAQDKKKKKTKNKKNRPELDPLNPEDTAAQQSASSNLSLKASRKRQVDRLKAKAETIKSEFLTSMIPNFDQLASKSEEVVRLRLKPSPSQVAKVRRQRHKIANELHKPGWGVKVSVLESPEKKRRSQRADKAVLQRAKNSLALEEKATKLNLQREMKLIRALEAKNTMERRRQWTQLVALGTSIISFRGALARGQLRRARRRSVAKIQAVTRGKIQRIRDEKAKMIRSLLGLRVTMVIANLRARVRRSHARCLTAFVLAIPASTKVFVALRLFRKNVTRVQRWWRSFLECKLSRIRCLVKIWGYVEDTHRMIIKSAVRKGETRGLQRSVSLRAVASLRKLAAGGGDAGAPRALSVQVRTLASECVKQHEITSHAPIRPSKVLRHSRSIDALNLKQLLRDLKPALGSSSELLPRKTMLFGAQKMLFSIAEDEKKRKSRRRHGGGSTGRKKKKKKTRRTRWSHNWDTWMVQMRRWNDADEGSGLVPRSKVPLEVRIGTVKAMLEECRLSYVRRSLVREGKLISNGDSVDVDSCDTKRLVSLHSMRHVIQGTMTMQDLFDRSARSLIFSPYTSKSFSETHLVDVIVDTQIQQQHL